MQLAGINTSENQMWVILYFIFSVTGFLGLHLIFRKKYKRALWYLLAWGIIIGSWYASMHTALPVQVFFVGLFLLAILWIIDLFNLYFIQTRRIKIPLPFILMILFFAVQVFFFEFMATEFGHAVREQAIFFAKHFDNI
jgi:hypothetical protein